MPHVSFTLTLEHVTSYYRVSGVELTESVWFAPLWRRPERSVGRTSSGQPLLSSASVSFGARCSLVHGAPAPNRTPLLSLGLSGKVSDSLSLFKIPNHALGHWLQARAPRSGLVTPQPTLWPSLSSLWLELPASTPSNPC